jgi:hypothetical protein
MKITITNREEFTWGNILGACAVVMILAAVIVPGGIAAYARMAFALAGGLVATLAASLWVMSTAGRPSKHTTI